MVVHIRPSEVEELVLQAERVRIFAIGEYPATQTFQDYSSTASGPPFPHKGRLKYFTREAYFAATAATKNMPSALQGHIFIIYAKYSYIS